MSDGLGNFLSPEGVIMFPLAITIDLVGIVLVIFGLDDFFITDAIGWLTIGAWSIFYSQTKSQIGGIGTEPEEPEAEMPSFGARRQVVMDMKSAEAEKATRAAEQAQKAATGAASETGKTVKSAGQVEKAGSSMAKWGKRLKFLEFIPYVGALPLWTVSVYFELKD